MSSFQDWWNSVGARSQIYASVLLKSALSNFSELAETDLDAIVPTIFGENPLLETPERYRLFEEFVGRCTPLFETLDEVLEHEPTGDNAQTIRQRVEREVLTNIEIKAGLLGLVLKEGNDLLFLADLAAKILANTVVNYAAEIEKLEEDGRRLAQDIETIQQFEASKGEATWEWELNLEGCPNLDCQHINPPGTEKCQECGVSLIGECPECYNEIPTTSAYCRVCGKRDLEQWNIETRFTVSIQMALDNKLYLKAYNLLSNLPAEMKERPELLAIKDRLATMLTLEPDQPEDPKTRIANEVAALRTKWIEKLREMLAEKHPDFVLTAKALAAIPAFAEDATTKALGQEIETTRQQVVQQGRMRKRNLLMQQICLWQQGQEYHKALAEVAKWLPTFGDSDILAKKAELEQQLEAAEKIRQLSEGPAWARPGQLQKQRAVADNLPVARQFDLGNGIMLGFILIPSGSFVMGSEGGYEHERPLHKISLTQSFYLAVTPVTQEQWQAVLGTSPAHFSGAKLPVEQVSWDEACNFLLTLTKKFGELFRLPTEAEWEYACRAGSSTAYSFGDDASLLDQYAWFKGNTKGEPHEVATKTPNAWGLYDLHGNVWEWCQDCYDVKYYQKSPAQDPMGPLGLKNSARVCRGGSWNNIPSDLRCSNRQGNPPTFRYYHLGFRPMFTIRKK